jgi:hypothetical protein
MPRTSLMLTVSPDSDVLHRVISMCHRRHCEIDALSYGEGSFALTVRAAPDHARRIGGWLTGLVDVLDVRIAAPTPGHEAVQAHAARGPGAGRHASP